VRPKISKESVSQSTLSDRIIYDSPKSIDLSHKNSMISNPNVFLVLLPKTKGEFFYIFNMDRVKGYTLNTHSLHR
jgi:hypothetical protein